MRTFTNTDPSPRRNLRNETLSGPIWESSLMARIWSLPAVLPAARIASPAAQKQPPTEVVTTIVCAAGILLPRAELVGMIMR